MRLPTNTLHLVAVLVTLGAAGQARADTATFLPVADAFVNASTTTTKKTNYGTSTTLKIDASPVIQSFLRFDVSLPPDATITGATVRLYTTSTSSGVPWSLYKVTDNTWSETGITYNNQPALGAQIGSSGTWSGCPCYTQASISAANVGPGLNSFAVATTTTAVKAFYSREGTKTPELVVTYTLPWMPNLSINDVGITEGSSGTASAIFTVSLSEPTPETVTVSYATADGTATAPGDYTVTSGQLTFAPNELSATVVVPVAGNLLQEPLETFQVNLSSPTNARFADGQGLGAIYNDDWPPLTPPLRGAFYYPRYPESWTVGGQYPHNKPISGYYDSSSSSVVDAHIAALDVAKVKVAIASWWGPATNQEATRIPLLLGRTQALGSALKWALYYEKEGSGTPTVAEIQTDLAYIQQHYTVNSGYAFVNGKPVLFVSSANDTTCEVADRWATANQGYGFYLVLKAVTDYQSCTSQPDGWHQYAPTVATDRQTGYSFSISPGFWKANETTPQLARDLARWRQNIRDMVASGEPWQLVTTFNQWGEGTAFEESMSWPTVGHGEYVEALANDGVEPPADVVVVAAGDIAGEWTQAEATAQLIDAINPTAVLAPGDMVYESGTLQEFTSFYAPTWGRHKAKTYPAPGNHDHYTPNLAGYCTYFGGVANCQGEHPYYSFNVGHSHIISLDSGCPSPEYCADPMVDGLPMRLWLAADLAANTKPCILAFWHYPRFSSGVEGPDYTTSGLWTDLYNAGADIVLNGHEHDYERFAPQNPDGVADPQGIREFIVGTGGADLYTWGTVLPNSEVRQADTQGVLKLTLRSNSYDWEFIPVAGQTFTDSGSGTCH